MKTNINTFLLFIGIFVLVGCPEDDDISVKNDTSDNIDYCEIIEESDGSSSLIPEDFSSCACNGVSSMWDYDESRLHENNHVPQLDENVPFRNECYYSCYCSGTSSTFKKWHCSWAPAIIRHFEASNPCISVEE